MKRPILIVATLAMLALALGGGAAWWFFVRRPPPPDINRVGGTVLVYQVDADVRGQGDPKDLPRALKERLDPTGRSHVQIDLEDPDRVRIAIPRTAADHDGYVAQVKELLAQVGHLEFRILANTEDDKDATTWARHWFEGLTSPTVPQKDKDARVEELKSRAERGLPPPPPPAEPGTKFTWSTGHAKGEADYQWVELGRAERASLQLGKAEKPSDLWQRAAQARERGLPIVIERFDRLERTLLYSRPCVNLALPPDERQAKGFDYFLLTRAEGPEREVTGRLLEDARSDVDAGDRRSVSFRFNTEGGKRFFEVTLANRPSGPEGIRFHRHLAIILDDQILSAPRLQSAIASFGQITGDFSEAEVNRLVNILRSGALPVKLKPVSGITLPPG